MNIFEKICNIMKDVEYLQKDDKVVTNQTTGAGYNAVSEEKVTGAVRTAMVKYGVVIIPIAQEHVREDERIVTEYKDKSSEKINRISTVNVTYRIQNIEDEKDYVIAMSSGTGVDSQDKGVGKAMTYAYKYLLLRTFAIPTGEDPDKIASEPTEKITTKSKTTSSATVKKTEEFVAPEEATVIEIIDDKAISPKYVKALEDLIAKSKVDPLSVNIIFKSFGYDTIEQIRLSDYMTIAEKIKGASNFPKNINDV